MNIDFNADEIFEMALQIERNGGRFYRLAAEGAKDQGVRQILLDLAVMEEEHENVFAAMRKELSNSDKMSATFDPHGEAASYLRAMADGHVFNARMDPKDFFAHQQSLESVLKKAIELEKDSIIFYLGMKEMVPQRLGKDRIDHIIREEMRHIVSLNRELVACRRASTSQKG